MTSALGETLRAEIEITSITPEEASSLRLRVAPPEAYRAAGVDYNAVLPSATVQVVRRADGRQFLRVTSDRAVLEPFVDIIIEATWASGRLVREYTMLFDPPGSRTAQAAPPPAAPVVSAAPTPAAPVAQAPTAPPPAPSPSPSPAPSVAAAPLPPFAAPPPAATPAPAPIARSPRPTPSPRPAAEAVAPSAPAGADTVVVRSGDSLSRIAARTAPQGISLDQMLVSLFRSNPQAFTGDNMNRLRAGAVLNVPTAEQAARLAAGEARDVIVAQSNDFAAYRQRLATGTTTAADAASGRQVRGQVQAEVDDRRQATAPTPDRLRLLQGSAASAAAASRDAANTQTRDDQARLAELARNVEELKRLQGSGAVANAPAAPAAPGAAQPSGTAAAPAAAVPGLPATPAAAVVPPPAVAEAPVVVAAAPPPPPAPAPTPAVTPPAPAPAPLPPPAAGDTEPGVIDALLGNSLLLPGAAVLLALLAGLGLYRLRGRTRKPVGETSFLESRLQPDSFFGASGGQRIDTRETGGNLSGNSSSMSYSLSQLDAIGDVDPVAEADVYLAYGRDLQAEEILKEAMRSTPERMAIRSKLLEVYAKRRDTRAYELLATQMFNLTRGEGEDWAKAQALGLTIDADNALYQPGGRPDEVRGAGGLVVADALNAATQPHVPPVAPPIFRPATDATLDAPLDLDLEFDAPPSPRGAAPPAPGLMPTRAPDAPTPAEITQPFTTGADMRGDSTLDFSLDDLGGHDDRTVVGSRPDARPPARAADDNALDFDLGTLEPEPGAQPTGTPAPGPGQTVDFGDFALGDPADDLAGLNENTDPLARKLELAEEFRQIGDIEGARDLLEEVVSRGEGPLKAKAQGMLDKLA